MQIDKTWEENTQNKTGPTVKPWGTPLKEPECNVDILWKRIETVGKDCP